MKDSPKNYLSNKKKFTPIGQIVCEILAFKKTASAILMTSYLKTLKVTKSIPAIFGFSTIFSFRNHQNTLYIPKFWVKAKNGIWAPDY